MVENPYIEQIEELMRSHSMAEIQYMRKSAILMHTNSKWMRENDPEFVRVFGSMPYYPDESRNAKLPNPDIVPQNCIKIRDIVRKGPDFVHKGKFLLCRSICPVWGVAKCNYACVDDPDGDKALSVILYNFTSSLPVGSILAIMNPWLKTSAGGSSTLRIDNTAKQVVILEPTHPILEGVVWTADLPSPSETKEADEFRMAGGRYFNEKNYDKALECYTESINRDGENAVHYANRCVTHLMMKKPELALEDAEKGLSLDANNFKLVFRKGKALFELRRFQECVDFLNSKTAVLENPEIAELLKTAQYGLV